MLLSFTMPAQALTASWYTYESAKRSGDTGIMANGERMKNEALTCASWDYPFKTRLKVTNLKNGKSVIVTVKDKGPNKRLVKRGRVIDLSKKAFESIANLKEGIINIKLEVIK